MKRNCLISKPLGEVRGGKRARQQRGFLIKLAVLVVGCVLLLQIGCRKEQELTEKPESGLSESKPTVILPVSKPNEGLLPTPPAKVEIIEPKPRRAAPRITFEKVIHNFGEVSPGTRNACEFKFTNTGDAILKIGQIRSTCGCTVPKLAKKEYAPGESGAVKVVFRVSRSPGTSTKRLYVPSNDKAKPKVTLTVKARVVRKVVHKPKELKLLLRGENAGCPEITLTSVDDKPFAIKSFNSPRNCITAPFDSSVEATKFVLQPEVHIENLKKRLRGYITIRLTHPGSDTVTIPYSVQPEFEVKPRSIVVSNAEPQKLIKRKVLILNTYGKAFEVESVSSKKDIIRVLSQENLGTSYKFELEITPPASGDKGGIFTDVLYVKIKGGEKLSINCRGSYSRNRESR